MGFGWLGGVAASGRRGRRHPSELVAVGGERHPPTIRQVGDGVEVLVELVHLGEEAVGCSPGDVGDHKGRVGSNAGAGERSGEGAGGAAVGGEEASGGEMGHGGMGGGGGGEGEGLK